MKIAASLPTRIARYSSLCTLDASDALVKNVGAKMAFGKVLYIIEFPAEVGQTYNYLGTTACEHLLYNVDNRIPISPIRMAGGSANRATPIVSGRDFSRQSSCAQSVAIARRGLNEAGLNHDPAIRRSTASSCRREFLARNGKPTLWDRFGRRSAPQTKKTNRLDVNTLFGEE